MRMCREGELKDAIGEKGKPLKKEPCFPTKTEINKEGGGGRAWKWDY